MTAWNQLIEEAVALGAFKAGVIPVSAVSFDRSFRDICETNACGKCGRCWMCPPDIGDIERADGAGPRLRLAAGLPDGEPAGGQL